MIIEIEKVLYLLHLSYNRPNFILKKVNLKKQKNFNKEFDVFKKINWIMRSSLCRHYILSMGACQSIDLTHLSTYPDRIKT